ncbi:hypothetical protein V5O48_014635 [Marasmius crinis-equi]|uniref:Dynamin family protein n=1 Tax=Marasmius crinis-equi TaxID=585013 RepID=A0ABR3EWS9_9AGAR
MSSSQPAPPEALAGSTYTKRAQRLIDLNASIEFLAGRTSFELNLPKIAVIGGQSAGKSSLVEAISKISVPRDGGTCTRCPMECTMSIAPTWSCNIYLRRIVPQEVGHPGDPIVQTPKQEFATAIPDPRSLELWLRRAQAAILCPHRDPSEFRGMGADAIRTLLKDDDNALPFSYDVVGVEVKGPEATPLTFVDLPGLIYNLDNKAQDYTQLVKNLVNWSITGGKDSNTVILVVVPMTGDMEGQEAMRLAKEQDPEGVRTVAVLTKPDLVGVGATTAQKRWRKTLDGEVDQLKHGYYCVRLPDDEDRKLDSRAFQRKAEKFFASTSPWSEVSNRNRFGVQNLVSNLSELLVNLIESNLPKMRKQVEALLQKYRADMAALPPLPVDPASIEMRRLTHHFMRDVENVIKGESHRREFVQKNRAAFATFKEELWRSGIDFVPYIYQPYGQSGTQLHQYNESFNSSAVPQWERATAALPAFRHRLELKDVRDVIDESIGWELPDFVPFQATVTLVRLSIDDWPAPTESCLSSVFKNSWQVFEEIIQKHFQSYPHLSALVRKLTLEEYRACYDDTLQALNEALQEEPDLLHTQRYHYLSSEKQLWAERFKAACGPHLCGEWVRELELMAGVRAYWRVAFNRFVDAIPRRIEHKLNRAFSANISERIRADVDNLSKDEAEVLMEEDKEIAGKRAKLKDVIDRLEQVEQLIASYTDGAYEDRFDTGLDTTTRRRGAVNGSHSPDFSSSSSVQLNGGVAPTRSSSPSLADPMPQSSPPSPSSSARPRFLSSLFGGPSSPVAPKASGSRKKKSKQ